MASLLMAATATADHFADVFNSNDETIKALMKADLLIPLDEVANVLDYKNEQKWGTAGMLETVMWDSKIYGVRPSLWPERYPAFYTPIIFNQTITAGFNNPDPREFVEKGEWTREKFIQLLNDCTVNDGENRKYGLSTFPSFIFAMAIRANGGSAIKKDGDTYVNDMGSPENIDAMQWTMDLITNNKDCFLFGSGWTGIMDPFLKGDAAMLMYPTWGLFSTVGMNLDSWGLLPFPNGPGREYGDWAAYYDGNDHFITIPRNCEFPEDAAYMLNELCEPMDDYPTYEELMTFYERNLFHDKRDFELYFKMAENCRYSYWYEGGNPVVATIGSGSTFKKTPAEIVASTSKSFQTIIDKYIAGNQAYFEALENEEIRDVGE
jgi:hypothetical protein